jgi:predicted amidohydrolase
MTIYIYKIYSLLILLQLAKEYDMVIVSPFLERCDKDFLWNSAVVIDAGGQVLGVSRKNHVPISGRQSEAYYYKASSLGVPVFQVNRE